MVDKFDKDTRSHIMSSIRGKWTRPEKTIHGMLKERGINHIMHPKAVGNPDIFIKDVKTYVFLDGCFWHCCPKHGHEPKSNVEFWKSKLDRNVENAKRKRAELKSMGFNVVSLWEHEINENPEKSFQKMFICNLWGRILKRIVYR